MESDSLEVLLIHHHPEFLKASCDLINDEWPRSETVRMMSLQASCDCLPTNFILVKDRKEVLGHCKLTPIPSIPESCFIETVVISKAMRGKKLGTYLMRYVEDYCRNVLKLKMAHLSTKGQEKFYATLDYEICAPVSIYGVFSPVNAKLNSSSHKIENLVPEQHALPSAAPPPPPPPMPTYESAWNNNNTSKIKSSKTYMFKYL
ncbi:N-alpha-acetyltransferase 80 [Cydia strobilella]|uniref:N-alpha-acetyltransferase 80 n=1 Tax=Cydia strobilella TaxID=1100964 RepID=UPI0030074C18